MLSPFTQWKNPIQQLQIRFQEIHIWAADLYKHSAQLEEFFNLLSRNEIERANQYKFEKDKTYFIITRGILRKILSLYLPIEPQKIKFYYNPYGKLYLKTQNKKHPLYFNLSHSEDLALYIFALNRRVGIDIEKIHHIDNLEDIAEHFFSISEYLKFKSIASQDKLNSFFKCWTRKEAFIKAIGNGLSYPLHEFEVSLLPNEQAALLMINRDPLLASKWSLHSLTPYPSYEAAFIFEGSYEKIEFWRFMDQKFFSSA